MFNKKILIIYEYLPPYITGAFNRGEFFLNFFPKYFKENIFISSDFDNFFKREDYALQKMANVFRVSINYKNKGIYNKFKKYFNLLFKKNKLFYYVNSEWINGCLSLIKKINYYPDIVFVSFPGYNSLELAIELKKNYFKKSKYILDLRDSIHIVGYDSKSLKSIISKSIRKKIENKVIGNFDFIISCNYYCRDLLIQKYKLENIKTITSGYFDINNKVDKVKTKENISIGYFGSFSISDKSRKVYLLSSFFDYIAKYNNGNIPKIRFIFYGSLTKDEVDFISQYEFCAYKGIIKTNKKLVNIVNLTNILMIYNAGNDRGMLTGKLFEYMAFKKPILVLSLKECELTKIVKEIGGECVNPINFKKEDVVRIVSLSSRKVNLREYEKYSWKHKEKELYDTFSSII